MRAVVLDNEAAQALIDADHRKHRVVIAHLAAVLVRRRRGKAVRAVVPTAVRVEAGWNRSDPVAAAANRFRVTDAPLDQATADVAADIVVRADVSVVDAHIGAVVRTVLAADDVVVLSSDPNDMVRVSAPKRITAVRI